ncbi:hypothetical protein ACFSO7_01110 [Bacillus sp. CGMCC 1.16607]|uniref:hypothetical protein n=1 Tax=Bacillus sp. CGMCC 1.16607 TaxID=3351842 RepID=UPI003626CA9E
METSLYASLLKEYISNSGLSLSEIEEKMRERGFNKNKAYLSHLQNGKKKSPSNDISIALAEITGGNPIRLITTALIEEIPSFETYSIIETISTFIATVLSINKEAFSKFFSQFLRDTVDESVTEEDILELSTYSDLKTIFDLVVKEYKQTQMRAIMDVIKLTSSEKSGGTNILHLLNDIKQDEEVYLIECLNVYRKLRLEPSKLLEKE